MTTTGWAQFTWMDERLKWDLADFKNVDRIRVDPTNVSAYILWQYGLWSFQKGDTKLERFFPKTQHAQRKLLNFEFWIHGDLSKSVKI